MGGTAALARSLLARRHRTERRQGCAMTRAFWTGSSLLNASAQRQAAICLRHLPSRRDAITLKHHAHRYACLCSKRRISSLLFRSPLNRNAAPRLAACARREQRV